MARNVILGAVIKIGSETGLTLHHPRQADMKIHTTTLSLTLAFFVLAGDTPESQVAEVNSDQRAKHLITVADDFIVDVYHNGVRVADGKRRLLVERFGATVERITADVR